MRRSGFQSKIAHVVVAALIASAASTILASPAAAAGLSPSEAAGLTSAGMGERPGATYLPVPLGTWLTGKVDLGSGNLLLETNDLRLPGVTRDLQLGAVYNSLATSLPSGVPASSMSTGWRQRIGVDTRLATNSDGSMTFFGPDGYIGVF